MDNTTQSQIDVLALKIAEQIENSDSRRQYMALKARIADNSLLTFKIKEFKRAHINYQLKLLNKDHPGFDEERHVSKLYSDLLLNDDARAFLEYERHMLTMMSRLHSIINASCGVDLDF